MSTESKGTPAPAAQPSAPAVDSPTPGAGVDLSDLQAEQDATTQKAAEDEIFDDINKTGSPKDGEADSDEEEGDAGDADAAEEAVEGTEEADADDDKPKKRSRHARMRDQLARLQQENATLRSRQGGDLSKSQLNDQVEAIVGPEPQEKDFDNY